MIAAIYARKSERLTRHRAGRRLDPMITAAFLFPVLPLLCFFLFSGCGASRIVPGEFVGSTYVNKTAGYAFVMPAGWRSDDGYRAQLEREAGQSPGRAVEFVLRKSDSLILGVAAPSWSASTSEGGGPPRILAGAEKAARLRQWFPEIPVSEHERLSAAVRHVGAHPFLLFAGPSVCTFSERVEAATTNRAWDRVAVALARGYVYVFVGNLCDPSARDSFEELLASVRLM